MGRKKTHEEITFMLFNINPNIEITGVCNGTNNPVSCKCKICGFDHYIDGKPWMPYPSELLRGKGCPACAGQAVLQGFNDLATVNPGLSDEWDYRRNGNLKPNEVTFGSSQNVYWLCPICGNNWKAQICSRHRGNGCSQCSKDKRTSFAEQAILFYCRQVTEAINRYTDFGMEIDVWLPDWKIGIEYNGSYWHKDKTDKDLNKVNFFKQQGIRIITVEDGNCNVVNNDNIVHIRNEFGLNFAIEQLLILLDKSNIDVDVGRDSVLINEQYLNIKKENSFANRFPKQSQQWDYDRNGQITPDVVDFQSNKKFYRVCPDCGVSYLTTINNWTHSHCCRRCAYRRLEGSGSKCSKQVYVVDSDGNRIDNDSLFTLRLASEFLGVSVDTITQRIKDGNPLLIGKYIGCTISRNDTK
jgi:hypothetical protein